MLGTGLHLCTNYTMNYGCAPRSETQTTLVTQFSRAKPVQLREGDGQKRRMLGEVEENKSKSSAHGKKLIRLNLITLLSILARLNNLLPYI